ncbi:hypothetical protein LCGC14_2592180, partial [marine sediment metagenome]
YSYKSVYTKCLELMHLSLLTQGEGNDPDWDLVAGVTVATLVTAKGSKVEDQPEDKPEGKAEVKEPRTLDQKDLLIQHLTRIGVTPKDAIPSIVELFFEGDEEDLAWMKRCLSRSAAGFVTAKQVRLTLDWWAKTRRLPYDPDELDEDEDEKSRSTRPRPRSSSRTRRSSRATSKRAPSSCSRWTGIRRSPIPRVPRS